MRSPAMSGRHGAWFLLTAVLLAGAGRAQDAPLRGDRVPEPTLDRVSRVFAADGTEMPFGDLLDALAKVDVVFCGETHLDEVTHRIELALYEGLLQRRPGQVVLSLEMFSTDVQSVLDDYVQGRTDEATFLARSNPWSNYGTDYRALIERARQERLPVVAANAPAALTRKVAMGGAAAFTAASEAEKRLLPPELLANSPAYWQRVAHATRGHVGGSGNTDPERLLYSTQSLWDNTMGWSCARALARSPGVVVLHVVGAFHVAYGQGTAEQLRLRQPAARIATVSIEPTTDLATASDADAEATADYVVRVEARARAVQEGFYAVTTGREVRYRLHAPARAAGVRPLLLWLPSEGLRAEDGLTLWQRVLGDEAVIAVIEPPYAQLEADLSRGGRWYWPDTFETDTAALARAIARTRAYLEQRYPIDQARVVLGGEGEGATVAASAALWGTGVARSVLAFAPRSYRKLGERGLPEERVDVAGLQVFAAAADAAWWRDELAQHAFRQAQATVAEPTDLATTVRAALGLPAVSLPEEETTLILGSSPSVRARAWHGLAAAAAARSGGRVRQVALPPGDIEAALPGLGLGSESRALAFPGEWPADVEQALGKAGVTWLTVAQVEQAGLPPAPGPFGGTTILVVPATASSELRAQWVALAERNPMQRYGRFYRLQVVFEDAVPGIAEALAAMVSARRSNALIVPAVFCADAARMQALQQASAAFAGQVDITWLPGLGGRIASQ